MKNIIKNISILTLILTLLNCDGGKDTIESDIKFASVFSLGNVVTNNAQDADPDNDYTSFNKTIDIYKNEPLVIEFDGQILIKYTISDFTDNSSSDTYNFNGSALNTETVTDENVSTNITTKTTTETEITFSYVGTSQTEFVDLNGVDAKLDGDFTLTKTVTVTTVVTQADGTSTTDTQTDVLGPTTSMLDAQSIEEYI